MTENEAIIERMSAAISIPKDIERYLGLGIIDLLLEDRSTGENLIWATAAYEKLGEGYESRDQITVARITGEQAHLIKRRAQKDKEEKIALTRVHAEVFTPTWICKLMIDQVDEEWFADAGVKTPQDKWKKYVESKRLEITCGEAPYLVNRYDASDGESIPVPERIGILDRKLQVITANTKRRRDWMYWTRKALKSTFGYEFQGDNLLIARINVLKSVEDHLGQAGYRELSREELAELAEIISWNLWQMDGLTNCVPFGKAKEEKPMTLFPGLFDDEPIEDDGRHEAYIKDWNKDERLEFRRIKHGGKSMKFDYVIGNPPYQEETEGTSDKPIYDRFMDGAFEVSDRVELITPARFLFNAGKTPERWNKERLADKHFKVLEYWQKSQEVFPNNDIKGGIAITYRDAGKHVGPIGAFTSYDELNSILQKVLPYVLESSLDDLIVQQNKWNLKALYSDYPECKKHIGSSGRERRLTTSIFTTVDVFRVEKEDGDATILGLINNKRTYRYIQSKYLDLKHDNFEKFKVIVPKSNGTGAIGEVLSTPLIGAPLIGAPLIGYTQSFIAFGAYDSKSEAEALLKYIKTKFARTMLGTLKITQDNNKGTWINVPQQDFTSSSDIDWSQSVAEIDVQLYKKYGLTDEEIDFIETHVKEMD